MTGWSRRTLTHAVRLVSSPSTIDAVADVRTDVHRGRKRAVVVDDHRETRLADLGRGDVGDREREVDGVAVVLKSSMTGTDTTCVSGPPGLNVRVPEVDW